ncbi:transcription repressor OFP6-like [Prosopis cineraria]|uniref:transcription repressor OFP6-like n=1 Tax=Prosopis cineraria TaxID=364024 RepID=UPI00240EFCED|nr:transcription repressor OFP6-like [Prosopis cineraria]
MSPNKRKLLRALFSANGGCGNCGTPQPFDVHDPTPKPKVSSHPHPNPTILASPSVSDESNGPIVSVSVDEDDVKCTTSTEDQNRSENSISGKLSGSIVVEMKSKNPYKDFRESMIQMIMERDIYSASELAELLQWFLKLNSPCYHHLILQAFSHICQDAQNFSLS